MERSASGGPFMLFVHARLIWLPHIIVQKPRVSDQERYNEIKEQRAQCPCIGSNHIIQRRLRYRKGRNGFDVRCIPIKITGYHRAPHAYAIAITLLFAEDFAIHNLVLPAYRFAVLLECEVPCTCSIRYKKRERRGGRYQRDGTADRTLLLFLTLPCASNLSQAVHLLLLRITK